MFVSFKGISGAAGPPGPRGKPGPPVCFKSVDVCFLPVCFYRQSYVNTSAELFLASKLSLLGHFHNSPIQTFICSVVTETRQERRGMHFGRSSLC